MVCVVFLVAILVAEYSVVLTEGLHMLMSGNRYPLIEIWVSIAGSSSPIVDRPAAPVARLSSFSQLDRLKRVCDESQPD